MVPEAPLEATDTGLVAAGDGWFVLNSREGRWHHAEGRGAVLPFEGDVDFPQVGVNLYVLPPGVAMSMYHWEADQEDFLVLAGEALLLVAGEERPLRQWDFVHCPPGTNHDVIGAGDGPCVVLAIGAREHQDEATWGGYPVDEVALRHNAGAKQETSVAAEAYAGLPRRKPTPYQEGWLPES
ncbi:MAG TPA: cupin domain-containing protein [Gaiellaceae bacterium]|nr:cupin domain-containing protein [Gaiellaceae bacterium]